MQNNKTKNVLYISPLPPPFGGIATWTHKIFTYGLPKGYTPIIVNTRILGNRKVFEKTSRSFLEIFRTSSIITRLIFHILKDRPSIAHLSCSLSTKGVFRDYFCALIVTLFRIPIVSHYRGNVADFPKESSCFRILTLLIRQSHINIAENIPSHELIAKIINKKQRPPVLLPNFIDDDIFQHETQPIDTKCARLRIVFAGGITKAKGCLEFVDVAKQMKHADFIMIGSVLSDMEGTLKDAPSNLTITGKLESYADVIVEMAQSDLLLFPSHTEGFPTVVLEAMSLGLPVVATKVGAIPEMVEEGMGGYLTEIGDINGIILAINKLIDDRELGISFGAYNKMKSRKYYSYSVVIKRLTDCYEQL